MDSHIFIERLFEILTSLPPSKAGVLYTLQSRPLYRRLLKDLSMLILYVVVSYNVIPQQ